MCQARSSSVTDVQFCTQETHLLRFARNRECLGLCDHTNLVGTKSAAREPRFDWIWVFNKESFFHKIDFAGFRSGCPSPSAAGSAYPPWAISRRSCPPPQTGIQGAGRNGHVSCCLGSCSSFLLPSMQSSAHSHPGTKGQSGAAFQCLCLKKKILKASS